MLSLTYLSSTDALSTLVDADPRHRDVFIVRRERIVTRRLAARFMGCRVVARDEAATIAGFTDYLRTGEIEEAAARHRATLTLESSSPVRC